MNRQKSSLVKLAAMSIFALFGAALAHAGSAAESPNAEPAASDLPAPIDRDLADEEYAGTCTCSSFLGAGCEVQHDRCRSGYHPECHCSMFGGNPCACKAN